MRTSPTYLPTYLPKHPPKYKQPVSYIWPAINFGKTPYFLIVFVGFSLKKTVWSRAANQHFFCTLQSLDIGFTIAPMK